MAAAGLFYQASHPGKQGTSHSRKVNKAGQPSVHRGPRRSLPPVLLTDCVHVPECSGVRTHAHTQTCTHMCIVHLHVHHPYAHIHPHLFTLSTTGAILWRLSRLALSQSLAQVVAAMGALTRDTGIAYSCT